MDRYLAVDEIAEYVDVSKDTVYTGLNRKRMAGYKVGRFWKFKGQAVDRWVCAGGAANDSKNDLKEGSNE